MKTDDEFEQSMSRLQQLTKAASIKIITQREQLMKAWLLSSMASGTKAFYQYVERDHVLDPNFLAILAEAKDQDPDLCKDMETEWYRAYDSTKKAEEGRIELKEQYLADMRELKHLREVVAELERQRLELRPILEERDTLKAALLKCESDFDKLSKQI